MSTVLSIGLNARALYDWNRVQKFLLSVFLNELNGHAGAYLSLRCGIARETFFLTMTAGGAAFNLNDARGDLLDAPEDGLFHRHGTGGVSSRSLLRPQWIAVTRNLVIIEDQDLEAQEKGETVVQVLPLSVQNHLPENQR
eukprot:scaffold8374_cov175-Amphora_coffeaeformis.AAC.102